MKLFGRGAGAGVAGSETGSPICPGRKEGEGGQQDVRFVTNLLSLAGKEVTYERIGSDGCADDHQDVKGLEGRPFRPSPRPLCPGPRYVPHF
jgi:hypothetical protein